MEQTVLIRQYKKEDIADVNLGEVWRYAGYCGIPDRSEKELWSQLEEVLRLADRELTYKVVYFKSRTMAFQHSSEDLEKHLKDCDTYYLFAATLGVGIDRLIAVHGRISPVKGLLLQALGAERIEALCDTFCEEIEALESEGGKTLTMRFSPGYGDLPLEIQTDIFRILDCNRRIGLSLNKSLLMSPSKSVTAIFGARKGMEENARKKWCTHKCASCPNTNCEYRGK